MRENVFFRATDSSSNSDVAYEKNSQSFEQSAQNL